MPAMAKQTTTRKRCTECRRWYWPIARLAKQQRVCSELCRLKRRRRLTRARRARDPARYREEERERKRRSRQAREAAEKRAAAAQTVTPPAPGHEPGETSNGLKSQKDFAVLWDELCDELVERSRARWQQELRRIAREIWRRVGQERRRQGAGSRTR